MICFWVEAEASCGRLKTTVAPVSCSAFRAPASAMVQNSAGLLLTKATLTSFALFTLPSCFAASFFPASGLAPSLLEGADAPPQPDARTASIM